MILSKVIELESEKDTALQQVFRWPTKRSKEWTLQFVSDASLNPSILAIIAIGSAVRPDVQNTDLDLLTVCARLDSLNKTSPPIEVDLRTYEVIGIDDKVQSGHDLLTWSIKFGRPLYQKDFFWSLFVKSWSNRLPLRSSRRARERASNVYRLVEVLNVGDQQAGREQAISYFTHLVRADLLDSGVYPASRPELVSQMRKVRDSEVAQKLEQLLANESIDIESLKRLTKDFPTQK